MGATVTGCPDILLVNGNYVDFLESPALSETKGQVSTLTWKQLVTSRTDAHLFYSQARFLGTQRDLTDSLFVGHITKRDTDYEAGQRIVNYTAKDYFRYLKKKALRAAYKGGFRFTLEQLIVDSGAYPLINPVDYKLGVSVDQNPFSSTYKQIIPTEDVTVELAAIGMYLQDALVSICEQAGCDFDINPGIGNLIVTQIGYLDGIENAPFDFINNQLDACIEDEDKGFGGLKLQEAPPDISSSYVVGHNGDLVLDINIETLFSSSTVTNQDIIPDGSQRHYPLIPLCDVLEYVDITAKENPCANLVINPTSSMFAFAGGNGSFQVTTNPDCRWMAVSNAGWILITSDPNGAGNGKVDFAVSQLPSINSSRTGTIDVIGSSVTRTHTVTQADGNAGLNEVCRYIFFAVNEGASNVSIGYTDEVPKVASASIFISPSSNADPAPDAPSGSITKTFQLVIDLTHPELLNATKLNLDYFLTAAGIAEGAGFTGGFPETLFPAPSYSASIQMDVSGGASFASSVSTSYEGGGLGLGDGTHISDSYTRFYLSSDLKQSPSPDTTIDLLPARGSIVVIDATLEVTFLFGANGFYEFANLSINGASAIFSVFITCE